MASKVFVAMGVSESWVPFVFRSAGARHNGIEAVASELTDAWRALEGGTSHEQSRRESSSS
jgi:hypothetical protein